MYTMIGLDRFDPQDSQSRHQSVVGRPREPTNRQFFPLISPCQEEYRARKSHATVTLTVILPLLLHVVMQDQPAKYSEADEEYAEQSCVWPPI